MFIVLWKIHGAEGEGGRIDPSGKLLCLCQPPKKYAAHALYHNDCWPYQVVNLLQLKSSMEDCNLRERDGTAKFSTYPVPLQGKLEMVR